MGPYSDEVKACHSQAKQTLTGALITLNQPPEVETTVKKCNMELGCELRRKSVPWRKPRHSWS